MSDIEQQLGDYEKQVKMLRVKLDAANNELERRKLSFLHLQFNLSRAHLLVKQTLIQSGIDNANQLNINGQKAIEELDKIKQVTSSMSRRWIEKTIDSSGTCTKINGL